MTHPAPPSLCRCGIIAFDTEPIDTPTGTDHVCLDCAETFWHAQHMARRQAESEIARALGATRVILLDDVVLVIE